MILLKKNSKNKTTSNIKMQQVFSSIRLDNFDLYLRDAPFSGNTGIVN